MKKLVMLMVVILVAFSPAMISAGDYDVRFDGTKIQFPKRDNVGDYDFSKMDQPFTFEMEYVPSEIRFMIGKIYRGVFKYAYHENMISGTIIYLTPIQWNESKSEFFVSAYSSRNGQYYWWISCPQNSGSKYECRRKKIERKSSGASSHSDSYQLVIHNNDRLSINSFDGWRADLEEVGKVPESLMIKK